MGLAAPWWRGTDRRHLGFPSLSTTSNASGDPPPGATRPGRGICRSRGACRPEDAASHRTNESLKPCEKTQTNTRLYPIPHRPPEKRGWTDDPPSRPLSPHFDSQLIINKVRQTICERRWRARTVSPRPACGRNAGNGERIEVPRPGVRSRELLCVAFKTRIRRIYMHWRGTLCGKLPCRVGDARRSIQP